MKKSTISLLALALFASAVTTEAATVTTPVMDATVEGSLLKIMADAAENSTTNIDFNFDGTSIVYTLDPAIVITNKTFVIDGRNAYNGVNVEFSSPIATVDDKQVSSSLFNVTTGGSLTLKNLSITGCQKIALFCQNDGVLNMENCKCYKNIDIKKESGNNGGVLRHSGGTVNIKNCVFSENEAYGSYGGGVISTYSTTDKPCTLNVSNSTFLYNQAANGGAIAVNVRNYNVVPNVRIENCNFCANYVANRGGAIYMQDAHTADKAAANFAPIMVNNTFVGNITGITTSDDGGAINLWARGTAVQMKPVLFNNLFAANYYDPWSTNRLNDIKCFYFAGDVSGGNVQSQTVDPQVSNNVYSAALDNFYVKYGTVNNSFLADIEKDKIFAEIEMSPIDGGEDAGHRTPKLYGDLLVPALIGDNIVSGKGVATFQGISAPVTDQAGNARPAVPSIGAMEYNPSGVAEVLANNSLIVKKGNELNVAGFEGTATVNVYDIAGKLVLSTVVEAGNNVNVANLANGLYIAKVNGSTLKFVK